MNFIGFTLSGDSYSKLDCMIHALGNRYVFMYHNYWHILAGYIYMSDNYMCDIQVRNYACLYTSKASNLRNFSPTRYFTHCYYNIHGVVIITTTTTSYIVCYYYYYLCNWYLDMLYTYILYMLFPDPSAQCRTSWMCKNPYTVPA